MKKYLLLLIILISFANWIDCVAQVKRVAGKVKTLSVSQSSGNGVPGQLPYVKFDKSNLTLLDPETALFCLNESSIILKVNYSTDNGGAWFYNDINSVQLQSDDASDNSTVVVDKAGIYYFVSFLSGTVEIAVTSTIRLPGITNKTILCQNGTTTLNGPDGYFSYQWQNSSGIITGATNQDYISQNAGDYFVQVTDNNGCVLNSNKVNISVYAPPSQLTITEDEKTNLILDNTASNINPESISWYKDNVLIKSFNDQGIVIAGGNGAGNGLNQLDQPYGISLDDTKNIYVADYNNSRIMKFTPGSSSGQTIIAGTDLSGGNPTDVLWDASNLNVATTKNVLQFPLPYIPSTGNTIYSDNAWGLSLNSNKDLYFANDIPDTTLDGSPVTVGSLVYSKNSVTVAAGDKNIGSSLSSINYPNGINVDNSNNNLYVADNLTDALNNFYGRIVRWAPGAVSGELIAGGNGYGNAPNQIWFAAGVTLDKNGNVYVTDAINNRVQLWKPGALYGLTIASGFTPWGIKVDDSLNVYVADQSRNQVLKFPSLLFNTFKPTESGLYKAVVTYPGGCSTTTNELRVSDVLPLNLINFTGKLNNNDALLTWQTASESNTSYFDIQRSMDAVNFITVGKVNAAGNSNSLLNYIYYDKNIISLNESKIYYRLKEADIDGKLSYSRMILIDIKKSDWSFSISPNPVKSVLKVRLNNLYGKTNLLIIDMAGRKIIQRQIVASGNDEVNFNIGNLTGGTYIIKVLNNGKNSYQKLVKD